MGDKNKGEFAMKPPESPFGETRVQGKGLSPQELQEVTDLLAEAAPNVNPGRIALLPSKDYATAARDIERGQFGGQPVASVAASGDEHFGRGGSTTVGKGFSIIPISSTYLDSDLIKHPKDLEDVLFHELGHYAGGKDQSEGKADQWRNVYKQRVKDFRQNILEPAMSLRSTPRVSGFTPIVTPPDADTK